MKLDTNWHQPALMPAFGMPAASTTPAYGCSAVSTSAHTGIAGVVAGTPAGVVVTDGVTTLVERRAKGAFPGPVAWSPPNL